MLAMPPPSPSPAPPTPAGVSALPVEAVVARPIVPPGDAPVTRWSVEGRVRLPTWGCGARVEVVKAEERRGRSLHVTPLFRLRSVRVGASRGAGRAGTAGLPLLASRGAERGGIAAGGPGLGCDRWSAEGVPVRFVVPAPGGAFENVLVRNVGDIGSATHVGALSSGM